MTETAEHLTPELVVVLAAAAVLAALATARVARLLIYDAFPPVEWARLRYITWANRKGENTYRAKWAVLATCPYCLAPYLAAINLGWALASGLDWTAPWGAAWWLCNALAALAYVAAIIVAYDGDDG